MNPDGGIPGRILSTIANPFSVPRAYVEHLADLDGLVRFQIVQPAKLVHAQVVTQRNAVKIFPRSDSVNAAGAGF